MNETNKIASIHLGKKSIGSEKYDSSLLVAIPRKENREQYDINEDNLPFLGCDIWHAYEFSALTKNNLPFSRLLKLKYDCKSEFLVESKSLKLYLNSFNMTNFADNISDSLEICKKIIEKDLSDVLKTKVEANFIENNSKKGEIFENFENILDFIDEKNIKIEKFKEAPEVLEVETLGIKEYYLKFDSLRSNCRVTHQPDFGDVFIYYKSKKHIKESSLVEYLSSFRSEFHFHEECCEMIFKRFHDILDLEDELFICALYTRRGGIDINPIRYSKNCTIKDFKDLVDIKKYSGNGLKQ
ncbi:NADPH-dependent 7-cyano-7-deazaguanine reductase QueF [bacterium]|nr:NADPH-dependent 7-cyano-7-deazaguanine reductase QueF [bacterium]